MTPPPTPNATTHSCKCSFLAGFVPPSTQVPEVAHVADGRSPEDGPGGAREVSSDLAAASRTRTLTWSKPSSEDPSSNIAQAGSSCCDGPHADINGNIHDRSSVIQPDYPNMENLLEGPSASSTYEPRPFEVHEAAPTTFPNDDLSNTDLLMGAGTHWAPAFVPDPYPVTLSIDETEETLVVVDR